MEIYSLASGTWSAASPMASPRYLHAATRLLNGKVLVSGGYSSGSLESAKLYTP